jgi:riboflavin transporter FmnP
MERNSPAKSGGYFMNRSLSTKKLAFMGVMAAISIILIYVIRFPVIPAAPYLEYEPGDIPLYIIAFLYGPLNGFIVTVIVCFIQGITVSASSGIIGIAMHIFATGAFVLVAGSIYKLKKNKVQEAIGLLAGIAVMTVSMCIWNLIFTPIFMGVPRSAVVQMLIPAIIPFNLIKAGANSVITFIIYDKLAGLVLRNR